MDNDQVIIDIVAMFKDRTASGVQKTTAELDKLNDEIEKTKRETDKATISLGKMGKDVADLARKSIKIPVKILDYATKPLRSIFSFATSIKGVMTGIFAGVAVNKAVAAPVALADAYSSAYVGFETLLGSQKEAQKMMNDIDNFAKSTPFKTSGVIEQAQRMLAMGWNPKDIIKDLNTIGNAAAGTGKGDEGLQRIILALSQIRSKGKLSTEELNQLAEAGVNAKAYIAEGLGYGTSDAGLAKMTKELEKGLIGSEQAIGYILEGMKEYDGLMEKTAKTTVEGLKSNLQDTFEINIVRKWGQGLQEGAIKGMSALNEFIDANADKLGRLGDKLQSFGASLSSGVADYIETSLNKITSITESDKFKNADLFGKVGLIWDKVVSEPFSEWWNSEGGKNFRKKAAEVGGNIGEAIAEGVMNGFGKMLGSAGKIIPGGESADAASYLSAGLLGVGAWKAGNGAANIFAGKSIKELAAGKLSAGGLSGLSVSAGTLAGIGGAVMGGLGLLAALNDYKLAILDVSATERERNATIKKGTAKTGLVAGGAGVGAAIGSIIPGAGTLLGAGIGAGIGGLAALLGGDKLGQAWQDWADGTGIIKDNVKALEQSAEAYQMYYDKAQKTDELILKQEELQTKIDSGKLSTEDMAKAQDEYNLTIKTLQEMYPSLITQYDKENGRLKEKLDLVKQISDNQKEQSKIELNQDILEFESNSADLKKKIEESQKEISKHTATANNYQQKVAKAQLYESEAQAAIALYESKYGKGSANDLQRYTNERGEAEFKRYDPETMQYVTDEYTRKYSEAFNALNDFLDDNYELLKNAHVGWKSANLQGFTNAKMSDYITGLSRNEVDSVSREQAQMAEYKAMAQTGYDAKMLQVKLNSGIDVDKYTEDIKKVSEYSAKIKELETKLQTANAEDVSKIQEEIDTARAEQQELKDGINGVADKLSGVYLQMQAINDELGKYINTPMDISVGVEYFNIPAKKEEQPFIGPQPAEYYLEKSKGYATGTPSAKKGLHWVGERGAELVQFNGGERVYNTEQSRRIAEMTSTASTRATAPAANINLGGININVDGSGGNADGIMSVIRAKMPEIADELCRMLATELSRIYSNMPLNVKGA